MKQQSKFSQGQHHNEIQHSAQQAGQEFASAEELLRHDAAQVAVPPQIAERLQQSTGTLGSARPKQSWWRTLFGR